VVKAMDPDAPTYAWVRSLVKTTKAAPIKILRRQVLEALGVAR